MNLLKNPCLIIVFLGITMSFSSCEDDKPVLKPELSITPNGNVEFSADGRTATINDLIVAPIFTVKTDQASWKAESNQTWLKIDANGNSFVLSADENTSLLAPTPATVTITAGEATTVVIYVTQKTAAPIAVNANAALVLGRGYDVTGRYAYSPEIKSAVLNFTRLTADNMVKKNPNLQQATFHTYSGSEAAEYTNKLATDTKLSIKGEAGEKKLLTISSFQGELSTRYSSERYKKDAYSFATATSRITKDAYFIENRQDPSKLYKYVSSKFLSDLETKTPEEIIKFYGTHVMLGGIWGARLDYHFSAKKKIEAYSRDSHESFSAKAETSLFGLTSLTVSDSTTIDRAYKENFESDTEEKYTNAYGGKPEYAQAIHTKQDYDKWVESIEDNQIWSDYYPESLVPIYELIENPANRNKIMEAYNNYLNGKEITVTSSLKTDTTNTSFSLFGAEVINGKGKASVSTMSLSWNLTVTLSKKGTNINANFDYCVEEVGTDSNKSRFEMNKDFLVAINKNDFIINESPLSWYSGIVQGTSRSEWRPVICPFLSSWSAITHNIERSTIIDHQTVGVRGYLTISYSYLE